MAARPPRNAARINPEAVQASMLERPLAFRGASLANAVVERPAGPYLDPKPHDKHSDRALQTDAASHGTGRSAARRPPDRHKPSRPFSDPGAQERMAQVISEKAGKKSPRRQTQTKRRPL